MASNTWPCHSFTCNVTNKPVQNGAPSPPLCHNFDNFAQRLQHDMSSTFPFPQFLSTFFQTQSTSCLLPSIYSSSLSEHLDNKWWYPKGFNNASRAACLRILQELDSLSQKGITWNRVQCFTLELFIWSFSRVHGFTPSSFTDGFFNNTSASIFKQVKYVPWEDSTDGEYGTIFDPSGRSTPKSITVSPQLVQHLSFIFHTGLAPTFPYCTTCECHFPPSPQSQWTRRAHWLPTVYFLQLNNTLSNSIAATNLHSSATASISVSTPPTRFPISRTVLVMTCLASSFCITFNQRAPMSSFAAFRLEATSAIWALGSELILRPDQPRRRLSLNFPPILRRLHTFYSWLFRYCGTSFSYFPQWPRTVVLTRQLSCHHVKPHSVALQCPFNTSYLSTNKSGPLMLTCAS